MGLRSTIKQAVKTAKSATEDFFLSCAYEEYSSNYTPGSVTAGAADLTDSFTCFDIEYDKTFNEILPFIQGERYVGTDPDEVAVDVALGATLKITEPDATVRSYTITGFAPVQQDVLYLMRLKPGG